MSDLNSIKIDGERLWSRLEELGKIGATVKGGCNRQALTDEDKTGRELFILWSRDAGCEIRIDEIGNIFARRPGRDNSLPPVIAGSHLDTQPTGGKYDGVYGVLAGLEVIETLNDHQQETEHPIEAVVWTNEEGCRFNIAMMGSAVWSGAMTLEQAYGLTDSNGLTVKDELQRIGHLGNTPAQHSAVKAAFEVHIEQGPVLEAANISIGVVTGVQHMSRHQIEIIGKEAHAGPTPMDIRKDPMMALAKFLPELYQLADDHAPHGRMTFGFIDALPGSNNTVPGLLTMTVDIRHPDRSSYDAMIAGCQLVIKSACGQLDLPYSLECFWEAPGVAFDKNCIDAVRMAANINGYNSLDIVSGAGHDACNVAAAVPTSMIFIPCRDGLSHNEAEYASPAHIEAGANVLLQAMLLSAG